MGYGDYLMLSGRIKQLKMSLPQVQVAISPHLEKSVYGQNIFLDNPFLTKEGDINVNRPLITIHNHLPGGRKENGDFFWERDFYAIPGSIYLRPEELAWAEETLLKFDGESRKFIFINRFAKSGAIINGKYIHYLHAQNKEWMDGSWRSLVRNLENITFIEALTDESAKSKQIEGVVRVNPPSFRHLAALANKTIGYIGIEGGVHHLYAALRKPAIVIFGGWISPLTTGYSFHTNLYRGDLTKPCGKSNLCDHCNKIMSDISADEVVFFAKKFLLQI